MKIVIIGVWFILQKLEEDLTRLETMVENLNELYETLATGNTDARPKVDDAIAHADSLRLQASDLSR